LLKPHDDIMHYVLRSPEGEIKEVDL